MIQPETDAYDDQELTDLRDVKRVSVVTRDNTELLAIPYRQDEQIDIALLRVPTLKGAALKFSQRHDYCIGDPVYTVGGSARTYRYGQ